MVRICQGFGGTARVAGTEVSYGVHQQSEALVHVPAQSIDKPLSAVTEGEDVLSPVPVPGR